MDVLNVAAVIVTRGDVTLDPIIDTLYEATGNIVQVWDNAFEEDLAVYGRYAAIERTDADVILVQDDDVILPRESIDALLAYYQPGHIVANMPARFRPHYPDSCLVGFGAIFDRDLPERAFERWREGQAAVAANGALSDFNRTCDVVFTTLTPRVLLDLPYEDREFANDPSRMWKQPAHHGERVRMLELARQVRDTVPA